MSNTGHESVRVIQTISSLAPERGGPPRTVPPLCDALVTQGVIPSILSFEEDHLSTPLSPLDSSVNTKLVPLGSSISGRMRGLVQFRSMLKSIVTETGADIIHDNGLWEPTNHIAAVVSRRTDTRLVVTIHGMLTRWSLQQKALKKKVAWHVYQRKNLQRASLIHATSDEEVDDIRRSGLRNPIAYIPNGVVIPDTSNEQLRYSGERSVLFLSRIHKKKGLLNLVKAWAEIRPAGWSVVIAGPDDGGHRSEIEAAIKQYGMTEIFSFLGSVDDGTKWDVYRKANLFVLPTYSENFGVVVAEALAAGIPVITTTGAPWKDLETFGCGWWIKPGVDPLVACLKVALGLDDAARLEMGRKGREYVMSTYGWPRVAGMMTEAYEWILGKGPQPDFVTTD